MSLRQSLEDSAAVLDRLNEGAVRFRGELAAVAADAPEIGRRIVEAIDSTTPVGRINIGTRPEDAQILVDPSGRPISRLGTLLPAAGSSGGTGGGGGRSSFQRIGGSALPSGVGGGVLASVGGGSGSGGGGSGGSFERVAAATQATATAIRMLDTRSGAIGEQQLAELRSIRSRLERQDMGLLVRSD